MTRGESSCEWKTVRGNGRRFLIVEDSWNSGRQVATLEDR